MIPCDVSQEARSGSRGKYSMAGGDCRPRGIAKISPEWLLVHHRRAWDTTLRFLGWNRRRPDCNVTFLRLLRACG